MQVWGINSELLFRGGIAAGWPGCGRVFMFYPLGSVQTPHLAISLLTTRCMCSHDVLGGLVTHCGAFLSWAVSEPEVISAPSEWLFVMAFESFPPFFSHYCSIWFLPWLRSQTVQIEKKKSGPDTKYFRPDFGGKVHKSLGQKHQKWFLTLEKAVSSECSCCTTNLTWHVRGCEKILSTFNLKT